MLRNTRDGVGDSKENKYFNDSKSAYAAVSISSQLLSTLQSIDTCVTERNGFYTLHSIFLERKRSGNVEEDFILDDLFTN